MKNTVKIITLTITNYEVVGKKFRRKYTDPLFSVQQELKPEDESNNKVLKTILYNLYLRIQKRLDYRR